DKKNISETIEIQSIDCIENLDDLENIAKSLYNNNESIENIQLADITNNNS
ncbi:810_t:CDS:2, partial [Cetraspora pellucida]